MRQKTVIVALAALTTFIGNGSWSFAEKVPGGELREFRVAILSSGALSFILPSTIVVDEKMKLKPLELIVTNETQEKHGFAVDKLKVKEVLKPGERKTIKFIVTDLDSLGGAEQTVYRMYDPLHPDTIGGQMVIKR